MRRVWRAIDCSVATLRWLLRTRLPRNVVVSYSPTVFQFSSLR